MQHLEVSCAVRRIYKSLGFKGLIYNPPPGSRVSSVSIATCYEGGGTVRGLNPGGGEIFRTCPDRPWGPPSLLLYNGYRVFPGGKTAGAWR